MTCCNRRSICHGTIVAAALLGVALPQVLLEAQDGALQPVAVAGRKALVIGNAAYEMALPLKSTTAEVRALEGALRGLGFSVTRLENLSLREMDRAVRDFSSELQGDDLAFFWFSGHGLQADGRNYLLPADYGQTPATKVPDAALSADAVRNLLEASARVRVLVLDACRDNPFLEDGSMVAGLAAMSAGSEGTLIAYPTGNNRMESGASRDEFGTYITHFLPELQRDVVELREAFQRTKAAVYAASGKQQNPAIYEDLIGKVYLRGAPAGTGADPVPPPSRELTALEEWKLLSGSDSESKVDEFIERWKGKDEAKIVLPLAEALREKLRGERAAAESGREQQRLAEEAQQVWPMVEQSQNLKALNAFVEKYEGVPRAKPLLDQAKVLIRGLRPPLRAGDRFRDDCEGCPELVVVPGGSFTMGSPSTEDGRQNDEGPQRRVTISGPLAVGVYEVTQEEYGRFVEETSHGSGLACWTVVNGRFGLRPGLDWENPGFPQTSRHPAVCVSWDDAQAYVRWLSGKTGEEYRLPTEAEWEYLVRAGSTNRFSYGDDPGYARLCEHANVADQAAKDRYSWRRVAACRDDFPHSAPVGSFTGNGFGLHDLHGNVWEWVHDWYGDYPSFGMTDPKGPNSGSARVLRGGSWRNDPRACRSAYRHKVSPDGRGSDLGFRVLRPVR